MKSNRLQGKVTIITGSGSGIGRGIAHCLANEGSIVVINDMNSEKVRSVVKEVKDARGQAIGIKADVTKPGQINLMVQRVLKKFGKIDILVNNAGVIGNHAGPPLTNITKNDLNMVLDVNFKGPFFMCQAVIPVMMKQRSGRIINISSLSAREPSASFPHYASMKAALNMFTQCLSRELSSTGITVNAVCPGMIWTPLWRQLATDLVAAVPRYSGAEPKNVFNMIVGEGTARREQTPEDIGMAVVFLASDAAKRITGEALYVAGPTS